MNYYFTLIRCLFFVNNLQFFLTLLYLCSIYTNNSPKLMNKKFAKFKMGILCGGPSLEKGISLNSARSIMDHLLSEETEVFPIYFDGKKRAYRISKAQLYSNTPSDFDFKLKRFSDPLGEKELVKFLSSLDMIFPVMHGPFGEDGKIQRILEKNDLPFVGSGEKACKEAFDKFKASKLLESNGFFTLPSVVLGIYKNDHKEIIDDFFYKYGIERAVVKPANGGSSIGVFSVTTPEEALEKVKILFSKRMDTRVVIEPFAEGIEFTVIILENRFGLPVALPPTEIETDYTENQIFDFRKKYLPTRQVKWHCPPRFNRKTIETIQIQAEQIFSMFRMRDFGRFDGWVLNDGNIWFCDFNPVSGMEQNSFLFQQAAMVGMTHNDVLDHIVKSACRRRGVRAPKKDKSKSSQKRRVNIIMGGDNSERQVSLMSGTNVWLKLRRSKKYDPLPFLQDDKGNIWKMPYNLCLNHTVEEIRENCEKYELAKRKLGDFEERSRLRLGLLEKKKGYEFFEPSKISLQKLLKQPGFFFIALHGGDGENGSLQGLLDKNNVRYNGPGVRVSRLCMDKWKTARFIENSRTRGVYSIPGRIVDTRELLELSNSRKRDLWKKLKKDLGASTLIVKPSSDGCSSGIVHLYSANDLHAYSNFLKKRTSFIPKKTFKNQLNDIEMPTEIPEKVIFEKFIKTDILRVRANELHHKRKTGWIEVTIGVLKKGKKIKALNPSVTVVENEVLTVEKKFQGGTGVNITPPPEEIVPFDVVKKAKRRAERIAREMGMEGYSRIDAFMNVKNGNLIIIEINTLPGLTPSTVLYHQALAENPPIFPLELLEFLIESKDKNSFEI